MGDRRFAIPFYHPRRSAMSSAARSVFIAALCLATILAVTAEDTIYEEEDSLFALPKHSIHRDQTTELVQAKAMHDEKSKRTEAHHLHDMDYHRTRQMSGPGQPAQGAKHYSRYIQGGTNALGKKMKKISFHKMYKNKGACGGCKRYLRKLSGPLRHRAEQQCKGHSTVTGSGSGRTTDHSS